MRNRPRFCSEPHPASWSCAPSIYPNDFATSPMVNNISGRRPHATSTSSRNLATAAFGKSRGNFGSSRPLQRTGSVPRSWTPCSNNKSASAKRS
jgi:hypothetical protein